LLELGFAVRLITPARVKPFDRRNKDDAADAAAICEAAERPGQRFVPVRSVENQAALMRQRARELMVGQRTAALNSLRGHLSEIGVVAAQGVPNAYALKELADRGVGENGEIVVPDRGGARQQAGADRLCALDQRGPLRRPSGRGLNQQAQQERGFAARRSASRATAKRCEPTERLGSPREGQAP
jgi:hypothetical protein